MDFSEEELEDEEEEEDIFYLWDTNKPIFDLFRILANYLTGEYYNIDSAILLALIKDKYLDVTDTLYKIPYIHSSYVRTIITVGSSTDGSNREDTSD
jgi:hypothetical protein